jgi:hypothetical protein
MHFRSLAGTKVENLLAPNIIVLNDHAHAIKSVARAYLQGILY